MFVHLYTRSTNAGGANDVYVHNKYTLELLSANTAAIATLFNNTQPWLYSVLLHSTTFYIGSTWLFLTLLYSTMALLDSTTLYHGFFGFPLLYYTLYHGSAWLLRDSTMALLGSTGFYNTLPRLYCVVLHSTTLYNGSTLLYLTLLHYSLALHGSH